MDYRETGLDSLNQLILERLYPTEKDNLTLEDIINYSWDQLEGKYFYSRKARTPEQQKIYEDNLPPGYISFRELIYDEQSYKNRQKWYYKSKAESLLNLLEQPW